MNVTCVVLAAGASRRFGSDKLVHPLCGGDTLLARAIRACEPHPTVVVCSSALAPRVDESAHVVVNDLPDLGMSHSLRLANERIDPTHAIVVLPADLALMDASRLARVIAEAEAADVTYPIRPDGTPGHPVIFSSRARTGITELPAGDTIRRLRDRADLTRRTLVIDERWPYQDVDVRDDL